MMRLADLGIDDKDFFEDLKVLEPEDPPGDLIPCEHGFLFTEEDMAGICLKQNPGGCCRYWKCLTRYDCQS